jgi:5-methylcytosine-specific restriction endonuclease McrA
MVRYKYREMMVEVFREYTASDLWRYVKKSVMERDNFTCVDCGEKLLNEKGGIVHHKHYKEWGKGNREEIDSCVFLCKRCHDVRHKKQEMKMGVPFWAERDPEIDGVSDEELRVAMQSLRDFK